VSATRRVPAPAAGEAIEQLGRQILRNRFIPVPPPEQVFVGDGGFLAIGVEFLKWFVQLGTLQPADRVLDLGCGIGRMALPLTQYLDGGSYDGIDVAASGIAWCREHIASAYSNFRFHHLDIAHPIYNPGGALAAGTVRLPFPDGAFDFIFLCSVLTHLTAAEVRAYAREIRRVMAPRGRLFLTAFLLNGPAREGLAAGRGALPFPADVATPELYADPAHPMAAVAFDEDFLLAMFLQAGLRRCRPALYGRWSGRATPDASFQDLNLFAIDDHRPPAIAATRSDAIARELTDRR
jgi:SAM-dependent methyltransferase